MPSTIQCRFTGVKGLGDLKSQGPDLPCLQAWSVFTGNWVKMRPVPPDFFRGISPARSASGQCSTEPGTTARCLLAIPQLCFTHRQRDGGKAPCPVGRPWGAESPAWLQDTAPSPACLWSWSHLERFAAWAHRQTSQGPVCLSDLQGTNHKP